MLLQKIKSSSKDAISAMVVDRGGMTKIIHDIEVKIKDVKEKIKVEKSNLSKILKDKPEPEGFDKKVSDITDKIVKLRKDLKDARKDCHRTLYLLYN